MISRLPGFDCTRQSKPLHHAIRFDWLAQRSESWCVYFSSHANRRRQTRSGRPDDSDGRGV